MSANLRSKSILSNTLFYVAENSPCDLSALVTSRVPDDVSFGAPGDGFPAWSAASAGAAGIETESRNGHENMAVLNEDVNPVPVSFFSVVKEFAGGHLALHESGFAQDV